MPNRLRSRLLALVLVGLIAWPAAARVYVECADGTPCPDLPTVPKSTNCCAPDPCKDHPAPPIDPRCVLKAEAPPPFTAPVMSVDLTDLPPVAIVEPALVTPEPRPSVVTPVLHARPPAVLAAKQGRSPRAPPRAHA